MSSTARESTTVGKFARAVPFARRVVRAAQGRVPMNLFPPAPRAWRGRDVGQVLAARNLPQAEATDDDGGRRRRVLQPTASKPPAISA